LTKGRSKKEVTGIDDVRRFFMVTATDTRQPHTAIKGKTYPRNEDERQRSMPQVYSDFGFKDLSYL
jgi:hypothetical protein